MFTCSPVLSIYALGIILLCSSLTDAVNLNNICKLLENGAQIASGNSCSTYYSCYNGIATLQNCASGTYFDKNAQSCTSQAPAYCVSSASNPCGGHADNSFVSKPGSCNSYYFCNSTGAYAGDCPSNLVFNPTKQMCDYKSNYNCQETNDNNANGPMGPINLCSYIQVGIYFGNAFNCAGWMKCTSDVDSDTGSCTGNLLYNVPKNLCDYPSNVQCTQISRDPQLNVPAVSDGGACSTSGTKKSAVACNQYYECDGTQFQLATCKANLYYDTNLENCVARTEAYNDCDRCVGTTKNFVNAFGTDCHNYLYCSNGVSNGQSRACPDNEFFNEEMGGCVPTNPEFQCCAASTTPSSTPIP
ncbi:peritrophin-48 [Zeugodacus cucurbitae]|uniref:Peritrophin-48 n=2 Tax=Dacini TaxID=43871 RepID=A0A0A1WWK5_ZEUCU|nr:peritrophin-48 [Zeugodacus cucurbitae]